MTRRFRSDSAAAPDVSGLEGAKMLTRAERLAQQRAERRALRRTRVHRPVSFIARAVHAMVGVVSKDRPDGVRAQRLAERRACQQRRVRRVSSVVVATFVVFGATAAYGFWSIDSGAGAASAKATTMQNVTIAATATSGTRLLPNATGDLTLNVTNPNHFSLKITNVQQSGLVTVASGGSGCTSDTGTWPSPVVLGNSGVSVPSQSVSNVIALPGTHDLSIPSAAQMNISSFTGCQGATFTVPVTITVQQQ